MKIVRWILVLILIVAIATFVSAQDKRRDDGVVAGEEVAVVADAVFPWARKDIGKQHHLYAKDDLLPRCCSSQK